MKKRLTAIIIALVLAFSGVASFAENENSADDKNSVEVVEKEKKLYAQSPHAILLDMKTGAVLYEKKANAKVYPADLTKIMTAVLVLENCKLEELATASEAALSNVAQGNSKMGIIKEERLSVRQLLYAMLLGSAADATNVLAEKTAGSIEDFVVMMNNRAKELGMEKTNFTNPVGDHDERHYSTASDMAHLSMHAMSISEFCEIVKCDSYSIPATQKSQTARKITNRNHFVSRLSRSDYYYKYATGIKTGYTIEAKSCIAASAEKNSVSLMALVFEAQTEDNVVQSFTDCANLFDYVFENYTAQTIVSKGDIVAHTGIKHTRRDKKIILKAEDEMCVLRHKDNEKIKIEHKDYFAKEVSAPVKEGEVIGEREYFVNGNSIGTLKLTADKSYKLDPITFAVNKMVDFVTSPWFFAVIALCVFLLIMAERRRRRILRKKRRDARNRRNRELMQSIDYIH